MFGWTLGACGPTCFPGEVAGKDGVCVATDDDGDDESTPPPTPTIPPTTTDPTTDTRTTADTGTSTPALANCPWTGAWDLVAVRCGTFAYDDWYDVHSTASLAIDHAPEGGCAVEATVAGPTCTRLESWTLSVPVGTSVDVTRLGATSCTPAGCAFSPSEPACVLGEPTGTEALTIDDSSGQLTAVGLLADTAPGCTLDLVTTWGL